MISRKLRPEPCSACGCPVIHKNLGGAGLSVASAVIRSLRIDAGWSMQDLAQQSGISEGTILNLENGYTTAQYATLRLLAKALNVPIERMYGSGQEEIGLLHKPAPNLKRLRTERGISNHSIRKLAHVGSRTLASLESGGTARIRTLRKIAAVLQVPVEELLGE